MSKVRLAFFGFRHGHIFGLYRAARQHPRVEVVAACEEDPETAAGLKKAGTVELTHASYEQLNKSVEYDAVAVGDYFGRRGQILLDALTSGKHVISDKPVCTRLPELEVIASYVTGEGLSLGCLLDLRDHGPFMTMRRLIKGGAIGPVHTVNFTAQHPLLVGKRPTWYFIPGEHGGTINDIGIHAIDAIPWLTGRQITEVCAARAWNARLPEIPHFQDAAQIMLRLDNGGGVLGDCSYLTPDSLAYSAPQYWRVTCHGELGVIETSYNAKTIELAGVDDAAPRSIPAETGDPTGCLDAFLDEIEGSPRPGALTTADVLDASRKALLIQQAADEQQTNMVL